MSRGRDILPAVKWYGLNALEFRHRNGSFMIDPYVSRSPERVTIPEEVEKYLVSRPDFVLMTHAHWDHLPDVPQLIRRTDTVLYASKTACSIMRSFGVPEKNLHELVYGEVLDLPGGIRVTALESRHMGNPTGELFYDGPQNPAIFSKLENWRCGEIFAFLIEIDGKKILNIGSANLHEPAMHGIDCDVFFCGISRWQPGFPELLMRNIHFRCLIPTHHDEYTRPLSDFHLRNDLVRLKEVLPEIPTRELPVLQWGSFSPRQGRASDDAKPLPRLAPGGYSAARRLKNRQTGVKYPSGRKRWFSLFRSRRTMRPAEVVKY